MVTSTITHRITGGSEDVGYNDQDRCGKKRVPTARGGQQGTGGFRKRLAREKLLAFVANLPPFVIGMEPVRAHTTGHGRSGSQAMRSSLSFEVRKAYVKSNKSNPNDAEGICEAVSRPSMRFVPVKTVEQQDPVGAAPSMRPAHQDAHRGNQIRGLASGA